MEQNINIQQEPEQKKKKPSTPMKITVLVVLIVLLAAGILLPIKLVPNAVSSVASTITSFFKGKDEVKLSTDRSVLYSDEAFTIKWTGKHQTNGTYSLSYACATGLRLTTSVNQTPNEAITCDNPYYFSPNDNTIELTAITESTRYTDLVFTLGFLENGASTIDNVGSLNITITNEALAESLPTGGAPTATSTPSAETPDTAPVAEEPVVTPVTPEPTTKPTTNNPSTPAQPVSNPNGKADLEVRAISTGYLNENGTFVSSASVNRNQQAAIKFQVVNVGDKNTGTWSFVADIPSETDPRYMSGNQQNLGPGDRIEFVLGFKNMTNVQNNIATITADASNFIPERSESNNMVRMNIVNGDYVSSNGRADLVVRMIDTGIVNRSNGSYSISSFASSADRVAVRFEVENIGSTATGSWKFQATLPTSDSVNAVYNSDTQPTLNPGEKRTYTIGFENLKNSGTNTVTVNVDSASQVTEANENNTASININRN